MNQTDLPLQANPMGDPGSRIVFSEDKGNGFYQYMDFCREAQALIAQKTGFFVVSVDIDRFNDINSLFGYSIGDRVLYLLIQRFGVNLHQQELFTRVKADHFVFLVKEKNSDEVKGRFARLMSVKEVLADVLPTHYNLVFSAGVYPVERGDEPLDAMVDKAEYARKYAKGSYHNTFVCYNQVIKEEMSWKREATASMHDALRGGEFELYLQPKMLLSDEQLVGAEALVRWNSKKYGLLLPARFIPVFEQNGFIRLLDFYMLEQVCIFLKHCITRKEIPPIPISVNFSATHVSTPDLVQQIFAVLKKHVIPPQLIEIEWSERAFAQAPLEMREIAAALRECGIRVSIDDFGSGNFAFGSLKELPVDIIKIDQVMLADAVQNEKSRLVLGRMLETFKSLRLAAVAEGVETIEQAELLYRIHCDMAQGFYYAKPLALDAFRQLAALQLRGSALQDRLIWMQDENDEGFSAIDKAVPQDFVMGNWELHVLGETIDMGLMKGFLDEDPSVQYINRRALEYLGYTPEEFRDILRNRISAFVYPDDRDTILQKLTLLTTSTEPQPFKIRALRKNGDVIWLEGHAACVVDHQQMPLGIYTFRDVTQDEHNRELLVQQSEQLETASRRFMQLMAGKNTPSFSYRPDNLAIQLHKMDKDTVLPEDMQKVLKGLVNEGVVTSAYRPMFAKLYSRLEQTQRASVRFQTPETGGGWYELTLLSLPDVDEGFSVQGTIRKVSTL